MYPLHLTYLRGVSGSAPRSLLHRDGGSGTGMARATSLSLSFWLAALPVIQLRICVNCPVCFKKIVIVSPVSFSPAPLIVHACSHSVLVLMLKHIGRSGSKCFQGVYNCTQGKEIADKVKINLSFCIAVSLSN